MSSSKPHLQAAHWISSSVVPVKLPSIRGLIAVLARASTPPQSGIATAPGTVWLAVAFSPRGSHGERLTRSQGKRERTTGLVLLFNLREHGPHQIDAVANVLRRARGNLPVFLHIQDADGRWAKLKSSDEFRINPDTLVKDELETILGAGRVQFARQANGNGRNGY